MPLFNLVKDDFKSKVKTSNFFSQSFFYAKWSVSANVVGTIGQYMDIFYYEIDCFTSSSLCNR